MCVVTACSVLLGITAIRFLVDFSCWVSILEGMQQLSRRGRALGISSPRGAAREGCVVARGAERSHPAMAPCNRAENMLPVASLLPGAPTTFPQLFLFEKAKRRDISRVRC